MNVPLDNIRQGDTMSTMLDNNNDITTIRVLKATRHKLKILAAHMNMSMTQALDELLDRALGESFDKAWRQMQDDNESVQDPVRPE